MYFEKSKSKLEADNAAIYLFRALPKAVRNQLMPPTNTDYSVSFRSNLMCGTVVVIDGIIAWRVYNKKFCLLSNSLEAQYLCQTLAALNLFTMLPNHPGDLLAYAHYTSFLVGLHLCYIPTGYNVLVIVV